MTIEEFLEKCDGVRAQAGGYKTRCPAHDDRNASLSVGEGEDGQLLIKCHAGCSFDEIMAAVKPTKQEPEAIYSYTSERGDELYQAIRFPGKKFRYRHFDPFQPGTDGGGWVWNMDGVRRVLYNLVEVDKATKTDKAIYVVEGEKDADRLISMGEVATCNPMGAGAWRPEYSESLSGAKLVRIIADKDKPGRDHARLVVRSISDGDIDVRVYEALEGKDVSDHLDAGYRLDQLVRVDLDEPALNYQPLDLFQPVPPIKWVIENVVVGGETSLLIADGGAGKSFVALAMALAVASGQPFVGCPVAHGKVIYVDEEGSHDLALQRLAQLGATDEQKRNIHYLNFAGVDLVNHPEKLKQDAMIVKPKLIIIDSHAKVTRRNEENSNNEMGRVWDEGFLPLSRDTEAAVLVIHHTNGFGNSRGASQIRNSADQVLTMARDTDDSQRIYASKPRRITKPIHFNFNDLGGGRYELAPYNIHAPWEASL